MLLEYERVTGEEFQAVYEGAPAADVLGKKAAPKPAKKPRAPRKPKPKPEQTESVEAPAPSEPPAPEEV